MLPGRQAARTMPTARIGGRGEGDAVHAGCARPQWGEDKMQTLKPLEPGVMFSAGRDQVSQMRALGVRCGQLAIPGTMLLNAAAAQEWKSLLERDEFTVVTVFATFEGEDYADIPTV